MQGNEARRRETISQVYTHLLTNYLHHRKWGSVHPQTGNNYHTILQAGAELDLQGV